MKFKEYISHHGVFTTADLLAHADSAQSAKQQLKLAVATGAVERVRRGLYVSNVGRFEGALTDPYELLLTLDPNAVLSYHTALAAHGIAHNISFVRHFRSAVVKTPFTFRGIRYLPHPMKPAETEWLHNRHSGSIMVTSREQTIIDCFSHPEWSGGIEEAIYSLTAFTYIDAQKVARFALKETVSMASRVGWLLEEKAAEWRVPRETIEQLRAASARVVSRLDKSSRITRGWSKPWNMRLPETLEETESWVIHELSQRDLSRRQSTRSLDFSVF